MAVEVNNGSGVTSEAPKVANVNENQYNANVDIVPPTTSSGDSRGKEGLSHDEFLDPNKIKVTITDPATPIVVLFGPPSCGKTMTLVRLTRYLRSQGFTVTPQRTFRPVADTHYRSMCDNFDTMVNNNEAAMGTAHISFMLVTVSNNQGRPICQILEAPGELYFTPERPQNPFPAYVMEIIGNSNRKVWSIFVEPDWEDAGDRANYVSRIAYLKQNMQARDKVLFVFNKIDKTPLLQGVGKVNKKQAVTHVSNLYPSIFAQFRNTSPLTSWIREYNCEFVPFMTGYYSPAADGTFTYSQGPDAYPKMLWEQLKSML